MKRRRKRERRIKGTRRTQRKQRGEEEEEGKTVERNLCEKILNKKEEAEGAESRKENPMCAETKPVVSDTDRDSQTTAASWVLSQ